MMSTTEANMLPAGSRRFRGKRHQELAMRVLSRLQRKTTVRAGLTKHSYVTTTATSITIVIIKIVNIGKINIINT